jgi:NAD(P)-dependent dehydrogenase (short-subunit alcohol dehydrogenase family)
VLVNNAGILRDRMLANMSEAEWDSVIKVHLKGTAGPSHFAAAHWRGRSKAGETDIDGRLINTTSPSGIYGNVGQANYGAAKAGVAGFTLIVADELARYGVTANAIAPAAITRLTAGVGAGEVPAELAESLGPRWIASVAVWLASTESAGITGRVFDVRGNELGVAEGWHLGPKVESSLDPSALGPRIEQLMGKARPNADMNGNDRA